ncbi:MAG: hypothetical protein LBR93_06660 [Treponema sp.]|nr:hypothetical protein [Treponema sp.]
MQRAGLGVTDIDCSTIPVTLTFARLKKNIWAELSELVTAYRCHLECAPEKPLVFAHSPYQAEPLHDDDYSYTFTGEHIFYLRKTARLKINLPVSLEKQEIWRYEEAPVLYDEFLQFHYRIIEPGGKERAVVYADNIDTQEEAESRLAYEGGPFAYSAYDVTTHHDRAILTVNKEADGDVYKAAIYGRPIVLDINRSCFLRNEESIAAYGTVALNVTGSYFSEHEIDGLYQEMGTVSKYIPELVYGKLEKPALAGLSCIVSDKLLYRFLGP